MTQNNLNHIVGKARHALPSLIEKLGSEENLMRAVLEAVKYELPEAGVFLDTAINVEGNVIWISGKVIDSVPRIGTFCIPDGKSLPRTYTSPI